GGMDADARDVSRALQADVPPREPRVGRLPDAVAVREVASDRRLAHPRVDDVRVRLRDRDRTDGSGLEVLVRDRLPVRAAVARLPDASARSAEVVRQMVA